jgi:hypothetical protein
MIGRVTAAALVLAFPLFTGCVKNGAVVVTPLNSYTKDDIIGKAEAYCRKYGMLPEEVRADTEIWRRLVNDVIRECVYADLSLVNNDELKGREEIKVSEEEIRSKYETLLASQKRYFSDKKEIVSAAITHPRDTILYYPKGLKWVRLFIVPFESEIRGKAAILLSEGKTAEYENLILKAEADMAGPLGKLRRRLPGDFEAAAAEYGGSAESLLYDGDTELFPSQLEATRTLKKPGDIAEYNIYQGHVFMVFDREPEYIEMPYGTVRNELAETIKEAKTILQRDKQMKKLYEDAIAGGSVKVRPKELYEERS